MSASLHAQIVDLLTSEGIDYRKIATYVARHHPTIFLRAAGVLESNKDPNRYVEYEGKRIDTQAPWYKEMVETAKGTGPMQGKIHAIKMLRENTGLGLMEAKVYVERHIC